jgi:hypothetical protein
MKTFAFKTLTAFGRPVIKVAQKETEPSLEDLAKWLMEQHPEVLRAMHNSGMIKVPSGSSATPKKEKKVKAPSKVSPPSLESEKKVKAPSKVSPPSLESDDSSSEMDEKEFVNVVQATTNKIPAWTSGASDVYIIDVWNALPASARKQIGDLNAFKKRLIVANQRGDIWLAEVNLPSAMPDDKVRDSLIEYFGSKFVFIHKR